MIQSQQETPHQKHIDQPTSGHAKIQRIFDGRDCERSKLAHSQLKKLFSIINYKFKSHYGQKSEEYVEMLRHGGKNTFDSKAEIRFHLRFQLQPCAIYA